MFDNLEVCADVAIKFVIVALREDVAVEIQSDDYAAVRC